MSSIASSGLYKLGMQSASLSRKLPACPSELEYPPSPSSCSFCLQKSIMFVALRVQRRKIELLRWRIEKLTGQLSQRLDAVVTCGRRSKSLGKVVLRQVEQVLLGRMQAFHPAGCQDPCSDPKGRPVVSSQCKRLAHAFCRLHLLTTRSNLLGDVSKPDVLSQLSPFSRSMDIILHSNGGPNHRLFSDLVIEMSVTRVTQGIRTVQSAVSSA